MVLVEAKVGSPDRRCEIAPVGGEPIDLPGCFWPTATGLDLQVPLSALRGIDASRPFWVSGFQTCCRDAARELPWDGVEGAQEVWRVP